MKYFSMFSGIGGFELGINRAYEKQNSNKEGISSTRDNLLPTIQIKKDRNEYPACIGYSEIDKYAIATYESHFGGHKNYGDATKINPDELPDFDMLCGGFPCQAFSIAGKRRGFEDTRGTLFFDIARIVKVKQPKILFLENVKGLLNHNGGNTFTKILQTLDEMGYDVEWQVLNSKNFGVPQNRERVFIIGHLRGTSSRQVFPVGGTGNKDIIVNGVLDTETWRKRHEQIRRVHGIDGISPTLPTGTGGGVMTKIEVKPVLTPNRPEKRQNGRRFKEEGEPSFTLTGQDIHGVEIRTHCLQTRNPNRPSLTRICDCGSGKLYQKCCGVPAGSGHLSKYDGTSYCLDGANSQAIEYSNRIRRLTPVECERLQGFPDNWTIGSDTQRYKQCGNAVTVNVIEAIAEKLLHNIILLCRN